MKSPEEKKALDVGAGGTSKGKKRQREGQGVGQRENVYAGRVTNAEVLDMLRGGGAGAARRSASQAAKLAPIEEQVIEYLLTTPAGVQSVPKAIAFLKEATSLGLTEVEKLQALNLRPALPVEVHLVIESCEQRLGDEGIERFVKVVEKHLPPMPTEVQEEAG